MATSAVLPPSGGQVQQVVKSPAPPPSKRFTASVPAVQPPDIDLTAMGTSPTHQVTSQKVREASISANPKREEWEANKFVADFGSFQL